MSTQGSKYRGQEYKRRDSASHKDNSYYSDTSRRRYDHEPSDGYRRHHGSDDRGRHGRYQDRDYYGESRGSRSHRSHYRSYHYDEVDDEEDDYYNESRGYRSSRYDDNPKYRKSSYHYDDRDRYDRSERYDRYKRGRHSYSPQTPPSDRRSPNPKKPYYSAPPLPPEDAADNTRGAEQPEHGYKGGERPSNNQKIATAGGISKDRVSPRGRARGEQVTSEPTDHDTKVADPRTAANAHAPRLTVEFDVVTLPYVAPADATLASPAFDMTISWNEIKPNNNIYHTPLELINVHMCSKRPNINDEWWLKGTHSLLMMGIPRHWPPNEVLTFIMESFDRILSVDDMVTEEDDEVEGVTHDQGSKKNLIQWCRNMGLQKFVLMFGSIGLAVNEMPCNYPLSADISKATGSRKALHNTADQPGAMALLIFDSESNAMQFWSSISSTCIKAYPSTITVCPDPSGWRIYTEALALWFYKDAVMQQNPQANNLKDKKTEDLLSVLTTKPTEEPAQKQKPVSQLIFVSPYVSNPEDASDIAKDLAKVGIKCMYHKPSKIMSLQFPNETLFSTLSVNHRYFTSPSGARVQCCFIKCLNKYLPLVKRTNVEHISNAVEKSKTVPPKPSKFKPPSNGVITIYNPNTS